MHHRECGSLRLNGKTDTKMSLIQLNRKDTSFIDPFLDQYLYGTGLNSFIDFSSNIDSIPEVVKSREMFGAEKRRNLHLSILEQYDRTGIKPEGKLKANILPLY